MKPEIRQVVEACSAASQSGSLKFPQIVAALMQAGVERYMADLHRGETIYYMPDGASHVVPNAALSSRPALAFSAVGVEQAVRDSQAGRIDYHSFCARIAAAGCVSYLVTLAGRRAVYYGRGGESHVELFPGTA